MTDDELTIPALEEHERSAVLGMLVHVIRIDFANRADREQILALEKAIAERTENRPRYMMALQAFGFKIKTPGLWNAVKKAIGRDSYRKAFDLAFPDGFPGGAPRPLAQLAASPAQNSNQKNGEEINSNKEENKAIFKQNESPPKISEAILSFLQLRGERGARVNDVKLHLVNSLNINTHEKTPGMTLYRLSKDGAVKRKGRVWYAVDAGPMNLAGESKTVTDQ